MLRLATASPIRAIRHNVTIDELGHRRERFADRSLKPPAEIHRLFARYPEALDRSIEIAGRCAFRLDDLAYQYPDEKLHPELTSQQGVGGQFRRLLRARRHLHRPQPQRSPVWANDAERRGKAHVPEDVKFATKPQLALSQIEAA